MHALSQVPPLFFRSCGEVGGSVSDVYGKYPTLKQEFTLKLRF